MDLGCASRCRDRTMTGLLRRATFPCVSCLAAFGKSLKRSEGIGRVRMASHTGRELHVILKR